MAVLAIGAVGAGIGYAFGEVALGFQIGTLIGGYLFAPKQPDLEGPRLSDLKVQASTYGVAIPRVYGSMRVAGNVIWSAPISETQHSQDVGGKGGGGATQTSYTYSQSFAIALCEGPIVGVRRIWANGNLIFNIAADATAETIAASNASASGITIHTGTETQEPDSLIQAYVGAANTPAYLGLAYAVFENLQLAEYGNSMPNLEFEVVTLGSIASYARGAIAAGSDVYDVAYCPRNNSIYACNNDSDNVTVIDCASAAVVATIAVGSQPTGVTYVEKWNRVYVCNRNDRTISEIDCDTNAVVKTTILGDQPYNAAYRPIGDELYVTIPTASQGVMVMSLTTHDVSPKLYLGGSTYDIAYCPTNDRMYVPNRAGNSVAMIDCSHGSLAGNVPCGSEPYGIAYCSANNGIYVCSNNGVDVIDCATSTVTASIVVPSLSRRITYDAGANKMYVSSESSPLGPLTVIDCATNVASFIADIGHPLSGMAISSGSGTLYIAGFLSNQVDTVFLLDTMSTTAVQISDIVSDLCADAGVTAVDVSALTDTMTGYVVANRGTARAAIEPLMRAFSFDAVESDGVLKFVKRGGAVAAVIDGDSLGAHEYGSSPVESITHTRTQEAELPNEIAVNYLDSQAAYQIGSQYARRLIGSAQSSQTVQLAMALTAEQAKHVADVTLYDAWQARTAFDFATTNRFAYVEPTDVIQVEQAGMYRTARILSREDQSGVIRFRALSEDLQVYDQSAPAPHLPAPDGNVGAVALTNLALMDIPLLRDRDDGAGYYVAACGYSGTWGGAQVFKSADDGASWTMSGPAILNASAIGTASSVLGSFGQNIIDETNDLTVVLTSGELAGTTELGMLNGANAALVGDEIIQYRDAALISAKTWRISGLIRGRRGTEWAIGSHQIADRFVVLDAGTLRIMPASNAEMGISRQYRGVTFGGFLDDAISHDLTYAAIGQECYAPVLLGGGRNAAGDITLQWVRRTRIGGEWTDYSDVPVGEETEAYEVDIYDGSGYATVIRTISGISTQTTSYTATQQASDFGAAQSVVYWAVAQMSATNGRGYEARGVT